MKHMGREERQGILERVEEDIPKLFGRNHPTPLLLLCSMVKDIIHGCWCKLLDVFLPTGTSREKEWTHRLMQRDHNSYTVLTTLYQSHGQLKLTSATTGGWTSTRGSGTGPPSC